MGGTFFVLAHFYYLFFPLYFNQKNITITIITRLNRGWQLLPTVFADNLKKPNYPYKIRIFK